LGLLRSAHELGFKSRQQLRRQHLNFRLPACVPVEEGRITLDKPVVQYLPKPLSEYPQYADLAGDARAAKITPRMLLSHTSSFPNFRQANRDLKLNINFEPGSRYAYSGEGIQLMQFVIEIVMQRPLADLMRERVFGPLQMTRTSMVSEDIFEADLANRYDEYGRSLGPPQQKVATAAGSMLTTLADFTRFMQAVAQGRGLKPATRQAMLTPQIAILSKHQFPTLDPEMTEANRPIRLSYGLGWGLYETPYGKAFFKEGHEEQGFRHYTVMFDQSKIGIVIMSNSSNAEGIFQDILQTLLGDRSTPVEWEGYTPYNLLPPRKPLPRHTEVILDSAVLDRYVGRYTISGDIVQITCVGKRVFYQEGDEPKVEIFAENALRFFSKVSDDIFTFELEKNGRAAAILVNPGPHEIRVKRDDVLTP
jgi:CubicO group peptidase (beta-lactamase class C family)